MSIKDELSVEEEIKLQKSISEWEALLTSNLDHLANALTTAANNRLMSLEHAKVVWKSFLAVSGMDIPKELKSRVTKIIEDKTFSRKD